MGHYTLIEKSTGRKMGCACGKLPDKVLEKLEAQMEESNAEDCEECLGEGIEE
ncbi:hypothetical protein L8C07_26340 [Paenibacillus sp. CMAA1739]|uniref:hypothetical protein n=1 Tax=Paenibacillus ottowii TaxID=2315729 RepID=UPI002DBFB0EC|nr:hypothetical protein [Paenibacillus sp. CMAA1739]MEC4569461.1 hypothetical protein [Paenibacillus sp. CMAA1739]